MSIILGIDPGSRVTGFGLIRFSTAETQLISYGTVCTTPELSFAYRMRELSEGLETLLMKYRPQFVVIEKIFMGKNADSAFKLGHARGVVMAEAAKSGAEIFEYATRVVKKSLTGKGSGDKEQVQRVVETLLKVPAIKPLDASDALALALYHARILQQGPRRILQENCL